MSVTGRVVNGVIVLPPGTALQEGSEVKVESASMPASEDPFVQAVQNIVNDRSNREEKTGATLPDDLSVNLDYYLHGHTRKQSPRTARWLGGVSQPVALTDQDAVSEASDLADMAADTTGLPSDLATNHDHYLHGLPKQ